MILLHTMIDPPLRSSKYRYIAIEILPAWARNDLTNFESEEQEMTGNGSSVNMLKLAWKNS